MATIFDVIKHHTAKNEMKNVNKNVNNNINSRNNINNMQIYIINTCNQFNLMYSKIKEEAAMHNQANSINLTHFIGFDLEFVNYKEYGHGADWILNKETHIIPCLIQIMTGKNCYLIELKKLGKVLPRNLIKIITCPSWIKMGVNCDQDIKILSNAYNLGHCSGSIDIDRICIAHNLPSINLGGIYKYITGVSGKEKGMSIRDWTRDLTYSAITYAANDAIMSYVIGVYFLMGRLENIPLYNITDESVNSIKLTQKLKENYVGLLNEYCQRNNLMFPEYHFNSICGGFECICHFIGMEFCGIGENKKKAKRKAAKSAFINIKNSL